MVPFSQGSSTGFHDRAVEFRATSIQNVNVMLGRLVYKGFPHWNGIESIVVAVKRFVGYAEAEAAAVQTASSELHILIEPVNDDPEFISSDDTSVEIPAVENTPILISSVLDLSVHDPDEAYNPHLEFLSSFSLNITANLGFLVMPESWFESERMWGVDYMDNANFGELYSQLEFKGSSEGMKRVLNGVQYHPPKTFMAKTKCAFFFMTTVMMARESRMQQRCASM